MHETQSSSKHDVYSKGWVKAIKIFGDTFQAYYFTRQAKRTFMIDSVYHSQGVFSCMIKAEQRQLLHKYVIYDMAVQRAYKVIENLKMSNIYLPILDKLLDDISQECYTPKYCWLKKR